MAISFAGGTLKYDDRIVASVTLSPSGRTLAALLAILLVIFVISLPGFGLEMRSFTQYAAWAAPVFLVLTVLVFALAVAGLATSWRRPRTAALLAIGAGVFAIITVLLDFSHVGGPPAPTGPFVLGIIAVIVCLLIFAVAGRAMRAVTTASVYSSAPPPVQPPAAPPTG